MVDASPDGDFIGGVDLRGVVVDVTPVLANIFYCGHAAIRTPYYVERSRTLRRQSAVCDLPVSLSGRMIRTALLLVRDLLHFWR